MCDQVCTMDTDVPSFQMHDSLDIATKDAPDHG